MQNECAWFWGQGSRCTVSIFPYAGLRLLDFGSNRLSASIRIPHQGMHMHTGGSDRNSRLIVVPYVVGGLNLVSRRLFSGLRPGKECKDHRLGLGSRRSGHHLAFGAESNSQGSSCSGSCIWAVAIVSQGLVCLEAQSPEGEVKESR